MLENSKAYSGIGVRDVAEAQRFYGETLEQRVEVLEEEAGLLQMHLAGDRPTLLYRSPDMTPASYTVLNFPVDDVEAAVDEFLRDALARPWQRELVVPVLAAALATAAQ